MSDSEIGGDALSARHPVGLVTVSYHSGDVLAEMLRSAMAATPPLAAGAIADNASEPAVRELAHGASYQYLALENRGYGAAVNAAVAALPASIEWILITNPDVVLEADTVEQLVRVGVSDTAIASVGPRIVDENGATYPSARAIPSLRVGVGHALFGTIWPRNPWSSTYKQASNDEVAAARDTGWLSGACLLVRRSAFSTIGGFDDAFFMYFEDVDLGYRLGKAGFRNVYAPGARIFHSGGHSTSRDSARMIDAHHSSARLFVGHKYPGTLLAPVRGVIGLGLRMRAAIIKRGL